jgi:hypothetical protein
MPAGSFNDVVGAWFEKLEDVRMVFGSLEPASVVQKDDPSFLDPLEDRTLVLGG